MAATNEKNLPTAELDKSTSHSNSNTDGKDGMYAWVICGVAFIGHTLSAGFSYTMGTYYVIFKEVFNHSAGVTSWVSSLNLGVAFLIGKYRNTVKFNIQFVLCNNDVKKSPHFSPLSHLVWLGGHFISMFTMKNKHFGEENILQGPPSTWVNHTVYEMLLDYARRYYVTTNRPGFVDSF